MTRFHIILDYVKLESTLTEMTYEFGNDDDLMVRERPINNL